MCNLVKSASDMHLSATSAGVVSQKRSITPCNPTAGTVTKGVIEPSNDDCTIICKEIDTCGTISPHV
jgi:hypothetical protein